MTFVKKTVIMWIYRTTIVLSKSCVGDERVLRPIILKICIFPDSKLIKFKNSTITPSIFGGSLYEMGTLCGAGNCD